MGFTPWSVFRLNYFKRAQSRSELMNTVEMLKFYHADGSDGAIAFLVFYVICPFFLF